MFGAQEFKNITALREAAAQEEDGGLKEDDFVYSRDVLDPPEYFYHSAKNMIETQLQKIGEKFRIKDVGYTVYIDGDGNFRNTLATIRPYKGNRVSGKPLFYNQLRQYLLDVFQAQVVHNEETDDKLACELTRLGKAGIIVGVDKDFLQVPGWHLNPNKGFRKIVPQQGEFLLYKQCLTGDATDNIAGAYKIGPKAASNWLTKKAPPATLWHETVCAYKQTIEKYGTEIYNGLTAEEAALENMRLVYLRRQPGEIWTPPEAI
jgi:hypothetical protein